MTHKHTKISKRIVLAIAVAALALTALAAGRSYFGALQSAGGGWRTPVMKSATVKWFSPVHQPGAHGL
jgi:hypothetical protein